MSSQSKHLHVEMNAYGLMLYNLSFEERNDVLQCKLLFFPMIPNFQ